MLRRHSTITRFASAKRPRPVLDGISGLYAVLSVHKLVSSYSGPLIQVRLGYDETTKDIYPDQFGRVSPDEIASFGLGRTVYVSKIYDQTGNGRHAQCTLTGSAQTHIGMLEATADLSTGRTPALFFGAQAPGQAYEILLTTGWLQNVGEGGIVVVGRSTYNTSAANKNIVSLVNNAAATRAQLSAGFSTTQFSCGARRLDADSFGNNNGPTYDTNWHVFVARFQWSANSQTLHVDGTTNSASISTSGSTSNTASAQTANIGVAVSRQGGYFGGQLAAVVLMTRGDAAVPQVIDKIRALFPSDASRTTGQNHTLSLQTNITAANGGQGFCGDATNFWVGKSNGDGVASTIYKYTYAGAAVTNFSGIVSHAQSVYLRGDHSGNIMVGDYDTTGVPTPVIAEIDKSTGASVRSWTMTGIGYAKAPTSCYYGAGQILYITHPDMTFTGAPHVSLVTVADGGTTTVNNSWRFPRCLGQMQGAFYRGGYLYVIIDDCVGDASHANGTVYKCQLTGGNNDDSGAGTVEIVAVAQQMRAQGGEQEGITHDGTNWYVITNSDGSNIKINLVTGMP